MPVKIVKLLNGETLIAEVPEMQETDHVTVINPLQLDFAEEEMSYSMIAFLWIPLTLEQTCVRLRKDHVIAEIDSQKELGRYYKRSLAFLTGDMETIQDIISHDREMMDTKEEEVRKPIDEEGKVIPLRSIRMSANTVH